MLKAYDLKQGDQGDNFYLLEEGTCDVFVQKSPGEPEVKVMTCTPDVTRLGSWL